jgi:hypothetical protein
MSPAFHHLSIPEPVCKKQRTALRQKLPKAISGSVALQMLKDREKQKQEQAKLRRKQEREMKKKQKEEEKAKKIREREIKKKLKEMKNKSKKRTVMKVHLILTLKYTIWTVMI